MSYAIVLTFPEGSQLNLPVLPAKLQVSSPGANKTATVLGIGEVLLLRAKALRTIAWESFFPGHSAPYVTGDTVAPIAAVRAIQEARDAKTPLSFSLRGTDLDVNLQMGIDDFTYDERYGDVGDIYYSIKLSEWKDYSVKRLILSDSRDTATVTQKERSGSPDPATTTSTYPVSSGDSLWAIAKRHYGDGAKWKAIYEANKSTIGANPNLIYPGQVLTLP